MKTTRYLTISKNKLEKLKAEFIGKAFGRLTILDISRFNGIQGAMCISLCACGVTKEFRLFSVKKGITVSCGCYNIECHSSHRLSNHPIYRVWSGIKRRCYYKKADSYPYYGAKGVVMESEWLNNFESFYDWCILNGWQKGLQIDRFPNKTGNYSPHNCRIVTIKQNNNNRADNRILIINESEITLSQAIEKYNIKQSTLINRLNNGMSDYDATHTKVRSKKSNYSTV